MFWWTFLVQIFFKLTFCLRDIAKIVRLLLAAVSINGLNPSNAEATFVQSTLGHKEILKTFKPRPVVIHYLQKYLTLNKLH